MNPAKELLRSGGYTYKTIQGYYLPFTLTRYSTGSRVNPVYTGNYKLRAQDKDIGFTKETKIEQQVSLADMETVINIYVAKWTRKYDEVAPKQYNQLKNK